MNLQQVTVATLWDFSNPRTYRHLDPAFQIASALRHVALHAAKDAGALIAAIEPLDHDGTLNATTATRAVRNLLVDALRACDLLGLSAEELVREWAEETTQQIQTLQRR